MKSFKKNQGLFRVVCFYALFSFLSSAIFPSYAQEIILPAPNQFVQLSEVYSFPALKGLKFDPATPFEMKFIIDSGNDKAITQQEASQLIRYFLAGLTIPEEELWVNMSPYEKERMITPNLANTDLGKDLLAQDYILKQISSSLTYPESSSGKDFWQKTYEEVFKVAKTTNLPVNTFNKIWIVPDKAVVYENEQIALITEATLKVMLEEDYLALKTNVSDIQKQKKNLEEELIEKINKSSSQVMREIILPKINQDVNSGKNFATLRQIYYSLILATWFKEKFKQSIYKFYIDKGKTKGIDLADKDAKDKIYNLYVQAFKKGIYNYIKTDSEPQTKRKIKRRYFSGGFDGEITAAMQKVYQPTDKILEKIPDKTPGLYLQVIPQQGPVTTGAASPIMVLSNNISLLEGARTGGYNIEHALSDGANGGIVNHSEPRTDLEEMMTNMLGNIIRLADDNSLLLLNSFYFKWKKEDKPESEYGKLINNLRRIWANTLKTAGLSDKNEEIESTYPWLLQFVEDYIYRKEIDKEVKETPDSITERYTRRLTNKVINTQLKKIILYSDKYTIQQTVLCVGETFSQRQVARTQEVIEQDLREILDGINLPQAQGINLRIAYEPRWAIGTGLIPDPKTEIQPTHRFIKDTLKGILDEELNVDYGGSLNKENVEAIFSLPDVDGGLIGGAAKKPEEIAPVIDVAIEKSKQKQFNIGMNWKAEDETTGLSSLEKFIELFNTKDLSKVQIAIGTPRVKTVKLAIKGVQASTQTSSPAYSIGYAKGMELQHAVDEAKKIIIRSAFDEKKTAFVIAGHSAKDITGQVKEYSQWRQKVRDIRPLTQKEKEALVKTLTKAKDFLLATLNKTTFGLIYETRYIVLLDDEAMNLDENNELILRGNPALVSDINGPVHKALFAHAGKHRYDEFIGSKLEKEGKTPRSVYLPLSQLEGMRRKGMDNSLQLLLEHEDKDLKRGKHIDETADVAQKIENDLKTIFGDYLNRQRARFEMEWLPKGKKVTTTVISFNVGGWAGDDAVHPYVREAVEESLIESVETRQIRSFEISLVGPYINAIVTHLNGVNHPLTEQLAKKIYAKAEEVAKELNLTSPMKRKLKEGEYNKPYSILETDITERKSEPLLVFTSNAVPGSNNKMLLDMFTKPENTYGLVIDKNMMGSFSFEILDVQTNKKVRLNYADAEHRMFIWALAGTKPQRYIITKVFPNAAPTLPKDLSPDEAVAVASYTTMPNREQVSVLMVRSQSGLPAVGEVIEPVGPAIPVGIGAGYHRGLFPATQKDSATTAHAAKITALGFQLAQGYLQPPRDLFDDPSFNPTRKDALRKSEKLAKMGIIQPGATVAVPEDLLQALEGRWIKLPEKGGLYQSKPSKTGRLKITLSLIKADVGGWVGHTDVFPPIMDVARKLLRWAMGEVSLAIFQKQDLRQVVAKAIEMEERRAKSSDLAESEKGKKELQDINAAIDFIMRHPGLIEDYYVVDGGDDLELIMRHRQGVNNADVHTLALNVLYLSGKMAEYHKQYNFLQDLQVDISKFTGTVQGMGPGVAELDIEDTPEAFFAAVMMDKTSAAAFSKFNPEAFTNFYHYASLHGFENVGYRGYVAEIWNIKDHKAIYLDMQTEMNIIEALLHNTEDFWIKNVFPVKKGFFLPEGKIKLVDEDGKQLTLQDVIDDDPIFVGSAEKLFLIGGKYVGKDDPVGLCVERPVIPYLLDAVPGKTVPGGLRGSTNAPLMPVGIKQAHPTRLDQPPRIIALGFNLVGNELGKPLDYFADPRFDSAREEAMEIYSLLRPLGPVPPSLVLHPEYTSVPEVVKIMEKKELWTSSPLTTRFGEEEGRGPRIEETSPGFVGSFRIERNPKTDSVSLEDKRFRHSTDSEGDFISGEDTFLLVVTPRETVLRYHIHDYRVSGDTDEIREVRLKGQHKGQHVISIISRQEKGQGGNDKETLQLTVTPELFEAAKQKGINILTDATGHTTARFFHDTTPERWIRLISGRKDRHTDTSSPLTERERFVLHYFAEIVAKLQSKKNKNKGASIEFKLLDDEGEIVLIGPQDGSLDKELKALEQFAMYLGIRTIDIPQDHSLHLLPDVRFFNELLKAAGVSSLVVQKAEVSSQMTAKDSAVSLYSRIVVKAETVGSFTNKETLAAKSQATKAIYDEIERRFGEKTREGDVYSLLKIGNKYFALAKENSKDQTLMTAATLDLTDPKTKTEYYAALLEYASLVVTQTGKGLELIEEKGDRIKQYLSQAANPAATQESFSLGGILGTKYWFGIDRFFQLEYKLNSADSKARPTLITFRKTDRANGRGFSMIVQPKINVLVNGYGTIGSKAALAARKSGFFVMISDLVVNPRIREAVEKGYAIYLSDAKSADAFRKEAIPVVGTLEELLVSGKVDVVIDGTPGGIGATNLQNLYKKYPQLKVILEGGEKGNVVEASFSSSTNYDEAIDKQYVRVVSCSTTGMARIYGQLAKAFSGLTIDNLAIRRGADPGELKGPNPDSISVIPAYHHGQDFMTILPPGVKVNVTGLNTDAGEVPETHFHVHVGTLRGDGLTVEKVQEILRAQSRVGLIEFPKGEFKTPVLFEIFNTMIPDANHPFIIPAQVLPSSIKGEVKIVYAVPQESNVVPENVNALQAMFGLYEKDAAIRLVDEVLGIDKIKPALEAKLPVAVKITKATKEELQSPTQEAGTGKAQASSAITQGKGGIDLVGIDVGAAPASSPINMNMPLFDWRNFEGFTFKIKIEPITNFNAFFGIVSKENEAKREKLTYLKN